MDRRGQWYAWFWANAWAELIGLGITFLLGYGIFTWVDEPQTPLGVLGFVLLMTATGVVEGSVVGWFQWRVIRRQFEKIHFRVWWLATLIGALTAWFIGSIPSSLMGMNAEEASGTVAVEPSLGLVLILACGMGLILGVILALPQWFVLRRHAERAWSWLPANSAAWGAGMVLIFLGIDVAQRVQNIMGFVMIMMVTLFVAGAVVGAIHGSVLVRLERAQDAPEEVN